VSVAAKFEQRLLSSCCLLHDCQVSVIPLELRRALENENLGLREDFLKKAVQSQYHCGLSSSLFLLAKELDLPQTSSRQLHMLIWALQAALTQGNSTWIISYCDEIITAVTNDQTKITEAPSAEDVVPLVLSAATALQGCDPVIAARYLRFALTNGPPESLSDTLAAYSALEMTQFQTKALPSAENKALYSLRQHLAAVTALHDLKVVDQETASAVAEKLAILAQSPDFPASVSQALWLAHPDVDASVIL
jgi:hypothetical protein